jgi:hypothetical protein
MSGTHLENDKPPSILAPSFHESKLESGAVEEKIISSHGIDWDGDNDELSPMSWTSRKKWTNLSIISVMSLVT